MTGRSGRGAGAIGIAFVIAAAGCATALPLCPAKGGPVWWELTSDHFVLRTDLKPRAAMETLRTLEDARAGMLAGMWPGVVGPPGRTAAVALASVTEAWAIMGSNYVGKHVRMGPFPATLVVSPDDRDGRTAKHELAHELANYFLPVQPRWFAEGIATFLATVRYDRANGLSILGEADAQYVANFRFRGPTPFVELMTGTLPDDEAAASRFYATAWMLTNFLYNRRRAGWGNLQDRLGRLQRGSEAFMEEFPDLGPARLADVLRNHAVHGSYVVHAMPLPPWSGQPRVRQMTDSEVHGLRAFLYWSMRDGTSGVSNEVVRAEIDESLRADRPGLEALAVGFYADEVAYPRSRSDLAALAVRAHPDQWMAWLMSADARSADAPERVSDLRRALQLAPRAPWVLGGLAEIEAREERWSNVLGYTNLDLAAGATYPQLWILHLAAARATGHCPEAELWGFALRSYLPRTFAASLKAAEKIPCRASATSSSKRGGRNSKPGGWVAALSIRR